MEDAHDSPFDVVRLDSTHWRVHVAGVPQLVSFTSRDGAMAAVRAQARQFYLHRGLPTQVRIADLDGTFAHTNYYNYNALNESAFTPLTSRSTVSQHEMLAGNNWLENDALHRHTELVASSRTDMETSYGAYRLAAFKKPSAWEWLIAILRTLPVTPATLACATYHHVKRSCTVKSPPRRLNRIASFLLLGN